jgi:hypothetical protein
MPSPWLIRELRRYAAEDYRKACDALRFDNLFAWASPVWTASDAYRVCRRENEVI